MGPPPIATRRDGMRMTDLQMPPLYGIYGSYGSHRSHARHAAPDAEPSVDPVEQLWSFVAAAGNSDAIVFDTETTGMGADAHIIEIGALLISDDEPIYEYDHHGADGHHAIRPRRPARRGIRDPAVPDRHPPAGAHRA